MKINTTYSTDKANKDISFILNPEETQQEKNIRIKEEVLNGVFK